LLGLPAQIRFKPLKYRWTFVPRGSKAKTSSIAKPTYTPSAQGDIKVLLAVSYSVEYAFTGVTPWSSVKPDIVVNANPVSVKVDPLVPPETIKDPPRLVNSQCLDGSNAWRC
jgi:hypothetical protein